MGSSAYNKRGISSKAIGNTSAPSLCIKRFDLSTLRTGIMAGSPCPIGVMKRVAGEMHCREVTIAYGLTGTSPVVSQTTTDDPIALRATGV
jgi:fatty-acyl-CoA synthase